MSAQNSAAPKRRRDRRKKVVASEPIFEHLDAEYGRRVISHQACGADPTLGTDKRWYCLQTHVNAEYLVLCLLGDKGFDVHIALCVEPSFHGVAKGGIGRPVIRKMFPGFVFVAFDVSDTKWLDIKFIRGSAGLLKGQSGWPQPVPSLDMFHLLQRAGENGYEEEVKYVAPKAIEHGSRVPRSKFMNITALSVRERLSVLMDVVRPRSTGASHAA